MSYRNLRVITGQVMALCIILGLWGTLIMEISAYESVPATGETSIEGRNLSEFTNAGWIGVETARHYRQPYEFENLYRGLESTDNGTWLQINQDIVSLASFSYTLNTSMICDVSEAGIRIKYYGRYMTAYVYPCGNEPSQRCYLEPRSWCSNYKEWWSAEFTFSTLPEKVEVGGFLLPDGYIVFEEIIIYYNAEEGCVTPTPTQVTSPEPGPTPTITMQTSTATATTTTEEQGPSQTSEESPTTTTEIAEPSTHWDGAIPTQAFTAIVVVLPTPKPYPDSLVKPDACDHDCEFVGIDCHNYYSCINFTRKEYYECNFEDGLAFNPVLKVCDRIENVEECRPTTTELPSTTTPPEEDCVCEYKPHETDCSKYYFCPESCRPSSCELRICPGGLLWSVDYYGDESVHQQCKLPEKANCVSDGGGGARLEFSCYKQDDGFYPDEKDCRSYWKCVEGRAQLYDCSKGYIYNSDAQACDMAARSMRFCTNNENLLI
ncbi:unnamed protein product [Orchesella dallaii]|uniref:Chitin-binding type-2 domain-containing protein n=1 Tax=Orchesella dallaii TaxID=48710 RepID=A0ABP1R140_9HEXA